MLCPEGNLFPSQCVTAHAPPPPLPPEGRQGDLMGSGLPPQVGWLTELVARQSLMLLTMRIAHLPVASVPFLILFLAIFFVDDLFWPNLCSRLSARGLSRPGYAPKRRNVRTNFGCNAP